MNKFLMLIGAFTIVAAVMMALVQHNLRRLLGYHAVSQVGYMVLGIGTGIPIGIAGGIFHMLNNTIYKSCLFLTGGNVENQTGTSELNQLGGLAKIMPITYLACLIASLSISGVPPFNGFVSKWMVYQGLVQRLTVDGERLTDIICLVAAMIGSALTLASFMKLIHAAFLGQAAKTQTERRVSEVSWTMWLPPVVLAVICVLFGIFAYQIPLKHFIFPAIFNQPTNYSINRLFIGFWSPGLATALIIAGLVLGLIVFRLSKLKFTFREDSAFIGGEAQVLEKSKVSGTEFYNTVKEINILQKIYKLAEAKMFDIYNLGQRAVFGVTGILRYLHNGVLPTYMVWCLLGMIAMFFALR